MSGMYGADVAQLRELGQHLDRCADQLDATRTGMTGVVQTAVWTGPDGQRFRGDWQSTHAPRIVDAVRLLRDAATRLRRNAEEQERASSADGSGPLLAPLPGVGPEPSWATTLPWDLFGTHAPGYAGPVPGDLGPGVFGGLFHGFQGFLDWTPDESAPIFGSLDLGFFASKIHGAGMITNAIGLGDVLSDPAATGADKAWASGDAFFDAVSDGAKRLPGPLGHLSGVLIAQGWDVVDLAAHTDWSPDQAQRNWDYLVSNPGDAIDGAAQAVVDYIPDLIDNLWPL